LGVAIARPDGLDLQHHGAVAVTDILDTFVAAQATFRLATAGDTFSGTAATATPAVPQQKTASNITIRFIIIPLVSRSKSGWIGKSTLKSAVFIPELGAGFFRSAQAPQAESKNLKDYLINKLL
jgi:hypothetical protein